ncbi:MAG TPA: pyridoxal-phosphate dependent enzyme, partial [Kineobactrum sp.]
PGNKAFKLQPHFDRVTSLGARRILSFGGAWSNHLHALAACSRQRGIASVGVIRGEQPAQLSATLADAQHWGMALHFVSRGEYRQRHDAAYCARLARQLQADYVIPEGGADALGVAGCSGIAELVLQRVPAAARVVVAVGTGATLAGLVAGLPRSCHVTGIVALKGDGDLGTRVGEAITATGAMHTAGWNLDTRFHCGGFARSNDALELLVLACERQLGLPLEPVYTGKAMLALQRLRASGEWLPQEPVVLVHTGGLQGRRGFSWLPDQAQCSVREPTGSGVYCGTGSNR